ncbi:MAG TPA: hypothetical protein VIJ00_12470, partial [Nakamurella sp.]
ITVATATPIANSVTEAHVMQRFLRPDLLRDAGVDVFDSWAATFGQTVTEMEMAPAGGGNFRQKTRFAKFQNVPEMLRMWQAFADVKTADDLHLPSPPLAERPDGQRRPEMVVIPPSEQVLTYVRELGRRAELVAGRAVDPAVDNMLKISTDGRKAALDIRLVQPDPAPGRSKVTVAADRIASIYHHTKSNSYRDPVTDTPHPVPGALQLVFCDLSTPTGDDRWNVYEELKAQLVDRGVPAEGIRFIHDARNDVDKGRLFAAARAGHVAVLLGSTQKMGVGTNVQARAIALHHLDCPWRPADLEQRDGRILRQGNQNPEVQVIRYSVEQSFDAYSWQTVERKARFIAQVMRGRIDVREMEDVGDNTLSFAEAKALASGDPLVLDKATADADLARLERLSRAHHRNLSAVSRRVQQADWQIDKCDTDLAALQTAAARTVSTRGTDFHAVVAGTSTADRTDAADLLRDWATTNLAPAGATITREHPHGVITHLGGHDITATELPTARGLRPDVRLCLADVPRSQWQVASTALVEMSSGVLRQMENHAAAVPDLAPRVRRERAAAEQDAADARAVLHRPFKYAADLATARARVADINTGIAARRHSHLPAAPGDDPPPSPLSGRITALSTAVQDVTAANGTIATPGHQATPTLPKHHGHDQSRGPTPAQPGPHLTR